jgi:hypothetical protein
MLQAQTGTKSRHEAHKTPLSGRDVAELLLLLKVQQLLLLLKP